MSDSIRALASSMVSRKKAGITPYILFLGAGASINSGCSSMMQIINDVLKKYAKSEFDNWENEIEKATQKYTEYGELLEEKINLKKRTLFLEIWSSLDHETQYSILRRHLWENKKPSEGYKSLVQLIKGGFIKTIFSTNLDNLLEKTLNEAGLHQPENFIVVVNGKDKPEEIVEQLNSSHDSIKIIKLHGSLESPKSYAFASKEIFDFEKKIKSDLSKLINQSLIVVGYSGQDRDVDVLFEKEGKEIHFIKTTVPDPESRLSQILAARGKGKIIIGNNGNFDTFFRKLLIYTKHEEEGINDSDSELSVNKFSVRSSFETTAIFSERIQSRRIQETPEKPYPPKMLITSLNRVRIKDENLPRAVILTALPVEYLAVRDHLKNLEEIVHPKGTIYEYGVFSSNNQIWNVAIAEIGEGNELAALEVERAIQYFDPNIILFVGVAGGVKDVKLGDVVVASKVYGYESGKADNNFKPRPEIGKSNYKMMNRAKAEANKNDWLRHLGELVPDPYPKVFVKPIAAGGKVLNSTRSTVYKFIKSNYGDTLAVEMEGYGFLKAAYANSDVDALVIRGISDLISGKEEADNNGFQKIASRHASAFAFEILAKSNTVIKDPKPPINDPLPETFISESTEMEFVLIPSGEFMMGSKEDDREKPIRKVTIKAPFYIGKYPVTKKQWNQIMRSNNSVSKDEDKVIESQAVENISWYDIQEFITKLNEKERTQKYRLPSEAEWEYACRARMQTKYSFGDDESKLNEYAWYNKNSDYETHSVGQKKPNPWGLYDMHGNVWEWVQDNWHDDYNGAPSDGSIWENTDISERVIKGGSWRSTAKSCRSATRLMFFPYIRLEVLGFRLLREQ